MSEMNELKVIEADQMQAFGNVKDFEAALRMANALASSTIVPVAYQKSPGNCLIAVDMAMRMKMPPLVIMQNLHVIQGRPSFSAAFIVGLINNSRRYKSPIKYELSGKGDAMACYCWAVDQDGDRIEGPTITMEMAKKEGWTDKNGSKWKTMPELMIRYRAASFFGRLYCPDIIMGLYSSEEVYDMDEPVYDPPVVTVEEEIAQNANGETIDIEPSPDQEAPSVEQETSPVQTELPQDSGEDVPGFMKSK